MNRSLMNARQLTRAALELAARGLRPVPMAAAKRPALKGWRERASLDPQAVQALFADAPHATGLAIAAGAGVLVVDLDRNHKAGADGVQSFAKLIQQKSGGEALALGPRVITPRCGVHLYFACDAPQRTRNGLAPGVDVKGDGGLATAPPTFGYRWAPDSFERDLPPAPDWLLRLIAPKPVTAPPPAPVLPYEGKVSAYACVALDRELKAVASAEPGARNDALFKASASLGGLCAAGMLPAETVARDLVATAHACGLVADDGVAAVEATIASGFKRGLANPRAIPQRRQGRRA